MSHYSLHAVLSWPSASMKFSSAAHVESTIKFLRSRMFENCCEKYTKPLFKVKSYRAAWFCLVVVN